jgi:hypothetical protein
MGHFSMNPLNSHTETIQILLHKSGKVILFDIELFIADRGSTGLSNERSNAMRFVSYTEISSLEGKIYGSSADWCLRSWFTVLYLWTTYEILIWYQDFLRLLY